MECYQIDYIQGSLIKNSSCENMNSDFQAIYWAVKLPTSNLHEARVLQTAIYPVSKWSHFGQSD
jgi:hypothetical protein